MQPKVSISVPIYNVSKFIEKCAESIFEQTFDDIEFVFVNDCTPDDSMEKLQKVIDRYPNRKPRVKIINHIVNQGLSSTRNSLIAAASGIYIFFVDSDDFIEKNTIELLYNKAIKTSSDVVLCNIFREWERGVTMQNVAFNECPKEYLKMQLAGDSPAYTCAKLMRRHLFDDVQFPSGLRFLEDFCTITRILYQAQKIAKVEQPLYHYIQYNTSALSKQWNETKWNDIVRAFDTVFIFLQGKDDYAEFSASVEICKLRTRVTFPSYFPKSMYETIAAFLATDTNDLLRLSVHERVSLSLFDNKYYWLFAIYTACFNFVYRIKKKWMG